MTGDEPELGLGPRYVVERPLGRGAASVVVAVRDRLHDVRRALKVATKKGQVRRYRTEYRRQLALRHPNVVLAYDFGTTTRGFPFYTLELVRGVNFGNLRDRATPEVLSVVAMQVLDALATIHARGWVHRDIKPRNVLVVGKGTAALVRLIDFGLLARAGDAGRAAGTLPYMAPEVARGEPIDGRADLYSLGMMMYEALLPEDMARTIEDVARRLAEQPTPPSRVNPVIPAALSDFVVRLIAPDRADRFPDAGAAAAALVRLPGFSVGRGPERAAAERLMRGGAISHRPRVVNQARRWAAQTAEEKRGCVCAVEGGIGVGKTPFLRELSMRLNLDGMRVVRVRTTREPGSPIIELLKAARAIAPDVFEPELPAMRIDRTDPIGELSRFSGQVAIALAAAFGKTPTALIIDDLHRAEPVAIDVLRSLAAEAAGVPLMVVGAADLRTDHLNLRQALGPGTHNIDLKPLRRSEVAQLAANRLHGLRLPRPAVDRLVEDSEGMPSLVERTLARLLVEGTIQRDASGYTFIGGRYQPVMHGDSALAAARIAQVEEGQQSVLWAAAVLGREIDAERVARIADTSVDRAGETLAALARLEILAPAEAIENPSYTFSRRTVLAHVYQDIPQEERRQLHDRAAALLATLPATGVRAEERVEHLLKGSDDDAAVAAAIEAGGRAAAVYADRRAIEYYARAYARLKGKEDARVAPVALRLGRLFERSGELERAVVWFEPARWVARDVRVETEATLGLAAVALVRGKPADAEALASAALEQLQNAPEPRLQAVAQRIEALVAVQGGDTARAERLLLSGLDVLESAGAEHEAIEVLLDLARIFRDRGEIIRSVRYARRARQRARVRGDSSALAEANTIIGRGFLNAGRFRAARRALFHGLGVARASGDQLRQASVTREIGNLHYREGDLEAALERYESSLELVRASRARAEESACLHNIGVVRTRLGELRVAVTALCAALELAEAIGDVAGGAASASELGLTYCVLGDLRRARQQLLAAEATATAVDHIVVTSETRPLLAWVALHEGNTQPFYTLLDDLDQILGRLEDPAHRATALYQVGICAAVAGASRDAMRISDKLDREIADGGIGELRVASIALRGRARAALGDIDGATESLLEAARQAAEDGLRPIEVEVRLELGRLHAGTDRGAEQLTRCMEVMRSIVAELPPDLATTYLSAAPAREARERFLREHKRVFAS
jgi:tetratricopeptide (TPR) repeat protein